MNEKIHVSLAKTLENTQTAREFLNLDDVDDMYDFLVAQSGGFTKNEFYDFLESILDALEKCKARASLLEDDELAQVSGGAKVGQRALAGVLSVLVLAGGRSSSVRAQDVNVQNDFSDSSFEGEGEVNAPLTRREKINAGFKKIGSWLWNNKAKIAAGLVITGGIIVTVGLAIPPAAKRIENHKKKQKLNEDLIKLKRPKPPGSAATEEEKRNFNSSKEEYEYNKQGIEDDIKYLDASKQSFIKEMVSGIPGGVQVLAGLGVLFSGVAGAWELVQKFVHVIGKFTRDISDTQNFVTSLVWRVTALRKAIEKKNEERKKKPYDPEESRELLELSLKLVKGQEKAKDVAREFFNRVNDERHRRKVAEKYGTKISSGGAQILYLAGETGCGKSMMASIVAASLTHDKPFVASAGIVDGNAQSSGISIVEQLFGTKSSQRDEWGDFYSSGRGSSRNEKKESSLFEYLSKTKNPVVIFNEVDKIPPDSTGKNPLDEYMRVLTDQEGDTARLPKGLELDARNVVFIFTSNESEASLDGRVTYDAATKRFHDPSKEIGKKTSRTSVCHDVSYLCRTYRAAFDSLKHEDYIEIARDTFAEYIGLLLLRDNFYIRLTIPEDNYDKMALYAEQMGEGARPIKFMSSALQGVINTLQAKRKTEKKPINGMCITASYDNVSNKFRVVVDEEETKKVREKLRKMLGK